MNAGPCVRVPAFSQSFRQPPKVVQTLLTLSSLVLITVAAHSLSASSRMVFTSSPVSSR